LLTARSTSRRTCGELLELDEKISSRMRHWSMPLMMASAQSSLGRMSRGATQQRTPARSREWQIASAWVLSTCEWLRKTS
jgi:hypothetical protein